MPSYTDIAERLAQIGLVARGAFRPAEEDGVPDPAATIVLAGSIGSSLWPAFSTAPEAEDGQPDPLDRWTQRVLSTLALELGATPLFPFGGPPHLPFQRWAQKAEAVAPSPIGILIHPDHGLWHAYRGALAFATPIDLPPRDQRARPCDSCATKPCLSTCPVGAFSRTGYDVARCASHIGAPEGGDCLGGSCLARRACPVAPDLAYESAQARFHMTAFLAARRGKR
ncbi:MAG: 4Fe-4S dicluster domain-containing protein [Alphaproteobacteria bacterium]|nr:4Fe-4S dicluster domain-containing protein [Alphaproteobacteria bacterium]